MDSEMLMTQKPQPNNDNYEARFHQVELELNSILEITQAINNNEPEQSLYKIYMFILRGNLRVERLALYVLDEQWNCKVNFGTKANFNHVELETTAFESVYDLSEMAKLSFENHDFYEFDLVIPVLHKDRVLAYVFVNQYFSGSSFQEKVDIRFVQALTNIIIVAIENKKLVRRQLRQEAFKKEMEIAKKVQSNLFPKKLPYNKNVKIKATYFPHDLIGGDYYDYISVDKKQFIICIADVSGKGIPAALLMSNFQATLRTLIRQTSDLKQIVSELNHLIYDNAQGEHFITCFIALYDKSKHTLTYINAGHNPAFLFNFKNNVQLLLDSGTTVLGAFSPLPFLKETTINGLSNFFLFNYTDGVTEVINPENEQFGHERLESFLTTRKKIELGEIHGNLIARINNFKKSEKFVDDITLLSCRVEYD
ncbi:MAG: GAF domain-containing SpoIIE family protein phosphatase [Microscillaceae bacterium]|nr:GAF domain-containing SpoIIE family protein phosphatase [Microscillaceae bacterium]